MNKRNLHDEASVGKMQRRKKEQVNIVEQPQAISSEKPKSKKMASDGDKHSQTMPHAGSNEKAKSKNKTKNKRKAEEISRASVEDDLETKVDGDQCLKMADNGAGKKIRKSKKSNKKKKLDRTSTKENEMSSEKMNEIEEEEDIYQISSGDEDCSKGMKNWVTNYYESRPGLDELQKRIDDFMTAHEERLEQVRQNQEAKAAEGGWTVVVHHKGRKKTTEAESGTAVGSVSQAALEDKVAKKKQSEPVAHGFYRFQKREAQRNEILALQSKFEQDKKRIQQLRAARKFKPY